MRLETADPGLPPGLSYHAAARNTRLRARDSGLIYVFAFGEARFGRGQDIGFAGDPDIERGQQENAHDQRGHEAADDHDGEGALGVRADGVGHGGGQQSEGGDEHGHHDGTKAEHGALDGRVFDRKAADAKLVDVFEHDDAGLHGHAEQRQESDTGGDAEVGAGEQEGDQAADGRDRDIRHDQGRPFHRLEHGVEDDEDDQNGDGQHDQQARVGPLLAGVFALPFEVISGGQLHLLADFGDGFFDGAAQVAAADAVFDGDVALVSLPVNFRAAVGNLNLAELRQRHELAGGG